MGPNYRHRGPGARYTGCVCGPAVEANPRYHVFSRNSINYRVRVRAFGPLASDSPPCASPIDLPRVHNAQKGVQRSLQKGLSLSSGSKIRANGCRGEAAKRLQSGRSVQPGSRRPLPLQPFWGQRLRQRDLRAPGGASEHAFCVLHATRRSTHITVFLGAPNQTRGRGLLRKCAVEKLEHTFFFYVFLYGGFAGFVRLGTWPAGSA